MSHKRDRTIRRREAEAQRLREKRERIASGVEARNRVNALLRELRDVDPDIFQSVELSVLRLSASVDTLVVLLCQRELVDRSEFELRRLSLFADLMQKRLCVETNSGGPQE